MRISPRASRLAAPPVLVSLPVILALALGTSSPVHAAWPTDPNVNLALCNATLQQDTPVTIADGNGGAIIVWVDRRGGSDLDIYAQRVSGGGTPLWMPDGVALCTATGDQEGHTVVSDGAGGAIVAWMDPRDTPFDIYAQHVSAAGAVQWGAGGVAICTAAGGQKIYPRIVSDGAGGAIVTWWDRRNGYNRGDIYAQRISGDGGVLWTADGVAVCVDSTDQQAPAAVSDGAGGAVIAWRDLRTEGFSGDIYAQRISAGGAPQWATDGVAVCTASNDQANTTIASDGAGGAVLAWTDSRGGSSKTYAQRISGTGAAQWTGDGVALCTGVGNEWTPAIAPDSAGGAIVVWRDDRFFDVNGGDVYAQRVSAAGAIQWSAPGVTVCNNIYGNQIYPQIIADGAGGAVVTWEDYRGGDYYAADVYARKLTAAGALQWTFSGAAISTATGGQTIPTIASDGGGGAIIAWQDSRNGYDDIYAQRVLSDGQLGGSAVSVPSDVPPSLALALAGPNPVRGGPLRVRFTLEGGAPASIELLDLAGRRLTARGVDAFGAGPHTLDLAEGRHLAPGIYWLRLRQGASTRLARVAVLE